MRHSSSRRRGVLDEPVAGRMPGCGVAAGTLSEASVHSMLKSLNRMSTLTAAHYAGEPATRAGRPRSVAEPGS